MQPPKTIKERVQQLRRRALEWRKLKDWEVIEKNADQQAKLPHQSRPQSFGDLVEGEHAGTSSKRN